MGFQSSIIFDNATLAKLALNSRDFSFRVFQVFKELCNCSSLSTGHFKSRNYSNLEQIRININDQAIKETVSANIILINLVQNEKKLPLTFFQIVT